MWWAMTAYLCVGLLLGEACLAVYYGGQHPELHKYEEKYMRAAYPVFIFLWPLILFDFIIRKASS